VCEVLGSLTGLLITCGAACLPVEPELPLDGPRFPTGLAVTPDGAHLVVVSSNFDLAFDEGGLLIADLSTVRKATRDGDGDVVVEDAYMSGVLIPSFGDLPILSSDGRRVLVPSRGANLVSSVELSAEGRLSCGGKDKPQHCGVAPRALQLPANDPLGAAVLTETLDSDGNVQRITALSTLLSSPEVFLFSDDPARSGSKRMEIQGSLNLGEAVAGVRSVVLRPALYGSPSVAIAATELNPNLSGAVGALLAVFEPINAADVSLLDVSFDTGAIELRDLVLVPGVDGDDDALVAVLRQPDGLARFELDDGGRLPIPRLAGLAPTCRTPTSLALAEPVPGVKRLLLTCQEGDVVQMIDPVTLAPTDVVRFAGRAPYEVVVNAQADPPEAYVSFFLDNSVGVFTLADGDAPALRFRGRIGAALPRAEDGRE
jgi:hypothetical protein